MAAGRGETMFQCRSGLGIFFTTALEITTLVLFAFGGVGVAQNSAEPGAIFGTVTADRGIVRGFRVKARDPVRRITYMVFTHAGSYQISNLPPGSYEVQVMEKNFDSPSVNVALKAGESKKVELALKALEPKPNTVVGAYTGKIVATNVELLDYDSLYPPEPERAVVERNCMGCHGKTILHTRRASLAGWRALISLMTSPKSPRTYHGVAAREDLSDQEAEIIAQYLAKHFGPTAPFRDLNRGEVQVDEKEVADALFIEYDLPDLPADAVRNPGGGTPQRSLHDPGAAPDGVIWFSDGGGNEVLGLNPRELDFKKRFQMHPVKTSDRVNVHGIAVSQKTGHVYWSELDSGYLGELDPKTGETQRILFPHLGGGHSVAVDSKENVWYDLFFGSKIGKLDTKTRKITSYDIPTPSSGLYGIIVDPNDNVWIASLAKHMIVKFNPSTEKFTEYRTPSQPSGVRRLAMDSKGKIWFTEFFANSLGVMDPETGKMTEYQFPLQYSEPYPISIDLEGNVWVSDLSHKCLVKFDQVTKKFTYYPFPELDDFSRQFSMDREGTLWFGTGNGIPKAYSLKPKGNRGKVETSRQQSGGSRQ